MRTLDWYLDQAKAREEIGSDRRVALAMRMDQSTVYQMRKRGILPSEPTMLKLAALAGVPAEEALLDLAMWKARDPESRSIYARIAERLKDAAAAWALWLSLAAAGGLGAWAHAMRLRDFIVAVIFSLFLAGHALPTPANAHARTVPAQADIQSGTNVYYGK